MGISGKRRQRIGVLAGVSSIGLLAAPAIAQDQASLPAAPAAVDASATDTGIGEIVVTAQRRSENLQNVPISITAITGQQLAARNITDLTTLNTITPGLNIARSGSDVRPAIRGINTEAIGANSDPRIGFYIDDVYQSRTSQALAGFVDLERVEVQKGPQGTLYGRNSLGGNVALYSATPKDSFSAGASLLYGNYNRVRGEGFVNIPITEGIAARVAGLYERMDGYVKNTSTGSDLGDEKQYYVRGSLRIAPTGSRLEVLLRGSYWHQGGNGISAFGYKSIGTPVDPALVRAPGGTIAVGGRTITLPAGLNGQSLYAQGVPFNSRFRDGIADINGADVGVPIEQDPYRINFDTVTVRQTRGQNYVATINYDAGPVRLRSITGYADFYALRSSDNDFSAAPIAIDYNLTKVRTFTQEVQILSNDTTSPFQWIVGGYFLDDRVKEFFFSDNNTAYGVPATVSALFPFGISQLPTTQLSFARSDNLSPVQLNTRSYAGFAQASYRLFERLRVTAGARYTSDRKRYSAGFSPVATALPGSTTPGYFVFDLFSQGNSYDFGCSAVTPGLQNTAANNAVAIANRCGDATFKFATYRGAVDFQVTRDHLLYASVSTGARSGGFNNAAAPGFSTAIPFRPEKVTAYEVGSKNRFLSGTLQLNGALFYNKYSDLQVQQALPAPNGLTTISVITNAGRARSYGGELEAIAKPVPELTVQLGYAYTNSQYTDYLTPATANGLTSAQLGCPQAPAATDFSCEAGRFGPLGFVFPNGVSNPDRFVQVLPGQAVYNYIIAGTGTSGTRYRADLPLSPRHTVTVAAAYEIGLSNGATLTPSVQTYLNSGYFNTDFNSPLDRQGAYTKTDVRLTFAARDNRFTVQGYAENLENTAVLNRVAVGANRSFNGSYALPRTYGVRGGVQF